MRSLDIETLLEDAFISAIDTWLDKQVTLIRWDDIEDKSLTPMVKVKASIADDLPGTVNYFVATTLLVDIAVFTSKKEDLNGRTANKIRGDVRSLLNESDLVSILSGTPGLSVYNNGVMPQSSSDVPDDKLWHKGMTVMVVATTENVT